MTIFAHGLIQRANLPIPEWLFGWAAGIVLVVSFAALAVLWPKPVIEGANGWRPVRWWGGKWQDPVASVIGVALWALVLVSGWFGAQQPFANFAPVFVFITFWVGLVLFSMVLGDVYRAFNPFRAIGRAAQALGVPMGRRPYPEKLGRWPAAAGLLCFTWLELASNRLGDDPSTLAWLTLAYSVVQFAGMFLYGVEPWIDRGEAFSVYYNLFSRLAPFEKRDGRLGVRPPLSALTKLDTAPGTVAVVTVMIGTVTFDGLSQGATWARLANHLNDVFPLRITNTIGLLLGVAIVAAFYALGIAGARSVGGEQTAERLRRGFVHSLVPIALVYVVAHYLSFFFIEGQNIIALASDPLGKGWNIFGTADRGVDYGLISQNQTWYLQVAFVVAGHVAALVLAHERALVLYRQARLAVRSQYWMLGVMVGFTSMALWLLAQAGTSANVAEAQSSVPRPQTRLHLVDFTKKPPYVNQLEIDPNNGDFLLTTNRGFWRINKTTKKVTQVHGTIAYKGKQDSVGTFLLVKSAGGQKLIGSGHPDHQNTLPQFLGFIKSDDMGKTWTALSRVGNADLHKIVLAHNRMYAYDAVLSAIVISTDGGKTFQEHFTPRGLIIDFVVDPADPNHIFADNDEELFESHDGGDNWRSEVRAPRMRLSWPTEDIMYRADQTGEIYLSSDRGRTFTKINKLPGEPYKFKETADPLHQYLALSDGTILETIDGWKSFKTVFKP